MKSCMVPGMPRAMRQARLLALRYMARAGILPAQVSGHGLSPSQTPPAQRINWPRAPEVSAHPRDLHVHQGPRYTINAAHINCPRVHSSTFLLPSHFSSLCPCVQAVALVLIASEDGHLINNYSSRHTHGIYARILNCPQHPKQL